MTIKILCSKACSKYYLKKKTNEFFGKKSKEWVDQIYFFNEGILFRIFSSGVAMDSLSDEDEIYDLACAYIEFMFSNTDVSIFGAYDMNKLSQVKGVRISEI